MLMPLFNKSQAALEFIMTYGWAILIVLVAIGALAYFGVLSPDRFFPQMCSFPAGISCLDFSYSIINDVPTLKFAVKNNLGWDATGTTVIAYDNSDINSPTIGGADCSTVESKPNSLKNDAQGTFIFNCDPPIPKGKYNPNIVFTYTKVDTNIPHQIKGAFKLNVG